VQNGHEIVGVVKNGAELCPDHADEFLLRRHIERHDRAGCPQAFGQAFLHHGNQNVLLGLEMIERAAGLHACSTRYVADAGAVEPLLAEKPGRHAQQLFAPVALIIAAQLLGDGHGRKIARSWKGGKSGR
jgi:hypothetical protein